MWETCSTVGGPGRQDTEVERFLQTKGSSLGPTSGTLQTGFWLAARVEFVQITLSKLLTACQGCIPEPESQLPWQLEMSGLRKQTAVVLSEEWHV